jgi:hypothetical protein
MVNRRRDGAGEDVAHHSVEAQSALFVQDRAQKIVGVKVALHEDVGFAGEDQGDGRTCRFDVARRRNDTRPSLDAKPIQERENCRRLTDEQRLDAELRARVERSAQRLRIVRPHDCNRPARAAPGSSDRIAERNELSR